MKVIGIAGEPGCGKSAVARTLAKQEGIVWIDLDRLAWDTYRSGSRTYEELISRFGRGILTSGEIDRSKLGKLVFSNAEGLADLNGIVHPALSERLRAITEEQQALGTKILLVEGALLGVSRHVDYSLFDAIIWLSASRNTRAKRLLRDERVQHLQREFIPSGFADVTMIDAEGSIEETAERVLATIHSLPDGERST